MFNKGLLYLVIACVFGTALAVVLFTGCNINNPENATYPWVPSYYPPDASTHIHDASVDVYDAGAMDN